MTRKMKYNISLPRHEPKVLDREHSYQSTQGTNSMKFSCHSHGDDNWRRGEMDVAGTCILIIEEPGIFVP